MKSLLTNLSPAQKHELRILMNVWAGYSQRNYIPNRDANAATFRENLIAYGKTGAPVPVPESGTYVRNAHKAADSLQKIGVASPDFAKSLVAYAASSGSPEEKQLFISSAFSDAALSQTSLDDLSNQQRTEIANLFCLLSCYAQRLEFEYAGSTSRNFAITIAGPARAIAKAEYDEQARLACATLIEIGVLDAEDKTAFENLAETSYRDHLSGNKAPAPTPAQA
jgi:hypothetical protein